jgi:hypothetical protein
MSKVTRHAILRHAAAHRICSGVLPLKMALAAGWSSFAHDVQQLMPPTSAWQSASVVQQAPPPSSHLPPSTARLSLQPASPAPQILFQSQLAAEASASLLFPPARRDATSQGFHQSPLAASNPIPSFSQLMPQHPVQPSSSSGSNRAFQLRNDSGVLVPTPGLWPNHTRWFHRRAGATDSPRRSGRRRRLLSCRHAAGAAHCVSCRASGVIRPQQQLDSLLFARVF